MDYLQPQQPLEYRNERVITTEQLASFYKTDIKNIHDNFSNNKDKFLEGKHYYFITGYKLKSYLQHDIIGSQISSMTRNLYLWTEKGAALHAKILNNDKAWEVYENLVDKYFRLREFAQNVLQ